MRIFGISVVRDEVDIIRIAVLHHLGLGIDRILAIDNGSSDGTAAVLRRLAARVPLSVAVENGDFLQDEWMSSLAQEAARAGADWVIPFDADELWTVRRGSLRHVLEGTTAGAIQAPVLNFVQRRDRRRPSPRALLSMTMRPAKVFGVEESVELMESGRAALVETGSPGKLAIRASSDVWIHRGNHSADGLRGPVVGTDHLAVLHAPLRARSHLAKRAEHGRRLRGFAEGNMGWHVRHFATLEERGRLSAEWAANSYRDGTLDVHGERHPVVPDERLRAAVAPWTRPLHRQALARLLRRSY